MEFKQGEIEGIIIKKLTKLTDERGFLVETFRLDNLQDNLQPVMSYVSYTRLGVARGPHEHLKQTDIFCFMGPGNSKIKLWVDVLFHHINTDEVYGSIEKGKYFYEDTAYQPNSPYSASKASSDHLVRAYHKTYGLPVTVSNCSNNYGPYQFPEKLIPLMILNILEEKNLPVYGDGRNVRDWLYVEDHCSAVWEILNKGEVGETYNIGGENE